MKTSVISFLLMMSLALNSFAQSGTITLTFTATNNDEYVALDSIRIENLDQDADTVLFWPDTVLILNYITGIDEMNNQKGLSVSQNYPNPIIGSTGIQVFLPVKDYIRINIYDIQGKLINAFERTLDRGEHFFIFYPNGEKMFVMNISGSYNSKTIKMSNISGKTLGQSRFIYNGPHNRPNVYKSMTGIMELPFEPGDSLRFIGYAQTISGLDGSDVFDRYILQSADYEFNIINGIPCPGIPLLEYNYQVYRTVQIQTQCWFKENLNWEIGNSWCFNNDPNNCAVFGRLYDWYTAVLICPPGWHLPDDEEWKILEGTIDTYYDVGDPEWDLTGWRGFDAGLNLKSVSGWYSNGNGVDLSGFTALLGGYGGYNGYEFYYLDTIGCFWSTTQIYSDLAWFRYLHYYQDDVYRGYAFWDYGFSIRCLKDD